MPGTSICQFCHRALYVGYVDDYKRLYFEDPDLSVFHTRVRCKSFQNLEEQFRKPIQELRDQIGALHAEIAILKEKIGYE